ncbi:MAG TPA: amino acid adenylation domain-containing protein [Candidatus Kapabacteria bacterium]|nr:amino acid adenylation domain-containing protein [Candidatus Kapabacteria bacterium]
MKYESNLDKITIAAGQNIAEKEYWLEKLSGELTKCNFPYDCREKAIGQYIKDRLQAQFPGELSWELMKLSNDSDARLHIILAAAVVYLLNRYTGMNDIIIGAPIYKQNHEGNFINTALALRIFYRSAMTFKELLMEVAREIFESSKKQNYPLEILPRQLKLAESFSENGFPLFETAVLLENIHEKNYISHINLNMIFHFSRADNDLNMIAEYNSALYEKRTIARIINHFEYFLHSLPTNLDRPLCAVESIPAEEKKQLLDEFNNTEAEYRVHDTIITLFNEKVENIPGQIAVIGSLFKNAKPGNDIQISYREFAEQIDLLALSLKEKGGAPDKIIGLMIERSLEMLIGIFGILKSGAAFLPIDPGYPAERIDFMLKDSHVDLLLSHHDLIEKIQFKGTLVFLEDQALPIGNNIENINNINLAQNSANLVYVIYTSGSTGKPKGALVDHRSLVNRLNWMQKQYPLDNTDTLLLKTPFTFDVSVWELTWWAIAGARLKLLKIGGEKEPGIIANAIQRDKVTVMHFVPSMLNAFLEYSKESPIVIKKIAGLRQVIASGEELTVSQVKKFTEILFAPNGTKLANLYGPTEATIDVSYFNCINIGNFHKLQRIPIGKPIDNITLYILGKKGRLQPLGAPGELYIAGDGLARGYLNRPQMTHEKFVVNPFSTGKKMYKTGDLSRWTVDGNIEFLGRIDQQVKIRGFRIELGEIEKHLSALPGIKAAVVNVVKDRNDNSLLCAYLVRQSESPIIKLKDYLRGSLSRALPDHMIPSYFIEMERIPLSPNGKVDRRLFPEPDWLSGEEYIPPTTDSERILTDIWSNVLGLEKIGVKDNFFNVGGDSIIAIKLVSSINKKLAKNLIILDLYNNSTIEKLALLTDQDKDSHANKYRMELEKTAQEIEALKNKILMEHKLGDDIEDIYPMSDIEKGMVFYRLRYQTTAVYHDQFVYQVKFNAFDPGRFKKAFILMMEKHPILRTGFNVEDFSEPVQIVYKNVRPDIEHYDISNMTKSKKEKYLTEFLEKDRLNLFDLSRPPLCRIRTFNLGNEDIYVVWIFFHGILDGWGNALLMTEINNTYLRLKSEPAFVPEKLKTTYKDFIIEEVTRRKRTENAEYWKMELDGYKRLDFSGFTDNSPSNIPPSNEKRTYWYPKGESLFERVETTARKYGSTVKNISFSAYLYMLSMISYDNDVVVGLVSNTRPISEEGDKIIGCFLNTIPTRIKIPSHITWQEFIQLIDKKMLEIKQYDHNSLMEILRFIGEKPQDENPIFDTIFNLVDFHIYSQFETEKEIAGKTIDDEIDVERYENSNTYFDFAITTSFRTFTLSFSFQDAMFKEESAVNFYYYYINILEQIISNPGGILKKDVLIAPEIKRQMLYDFNNNPGLESIPGAAYPCNQTVYQLIEKQAEYKPDRIAVTYEANSLTYKELDRRADRLAAYLKIHGTNEDTLVGILMIRTQFMVESILATWKAGGAYIPLDLQYPAERIIGILNDSASLVLIMQPEYANPVLERLYKGIIINVKQVSGIPVDNPVYIKSSININNLAYVIYTSGSTGKPKGAMVEQKGMSNHIQAKIAELQLSDQSVVLQNASHTFDISVWQFFSALVAGGKTVIYANEKIMDPTHFFNGIISDRVTIVEVVPSYLALLIETVHTNLPPIPLAIRWLLVTGEEVKSNLVKKWLAIYPDIKIINAYGPTEASDDITHFIIDKPLDQERIPIGKPIPNLAIYIVDNNMDLCPIGVKGEICVAGVAVGRGYLNDLEKTKAVFIENPFSKEKGISLYKTGDIGRWTRYGLIEFFGRKDFQVKIRGFRIELGEIESKLLTYPLVKNAAVITFEEKNDKFLCAYLVADDGLNIVDLRKYLLNHLPSYMIPSQFVKLEKIPLTPNGKVDRKALPALETKINENITAPSDEIEKRLTELWAELLGLNAKTIGIDSDFFESGGHSIAAIGLSAKIHKEFDIKIPIAEIFRKPTIRALSDYLSHADKEYYTTIGAAEKKEYYTLSFSQQSTFLAQQLAMDNTGFNLPSALILDGVPDVEQLARNFRKLIDRHESLRTSFEIINGVVRQRIYRDVKFTIEQYSGNSDDTDTVMMRFIRPFDLAKAPLLRVGVMTIIDSITPKYILMIEIHHIVCDGVSHQVLTRDFRALSLGEELHPLKLHYKDYSEWENSKKQQDIIAAQEKFWLAEFKSEAPPMLLPTDFSRPEIKSFAGDIINFKYDREIVEHLRRIALQEDVTLYMLLLSIFNVFLAKLTGNEDIVVGTSAAGRRHAELQNVIGMFVNMLAVRTYPTGEKNFRQFLKEVKEKTIEIFENQEYPFEKLVEKVVGQRNRSHHPLFDVAFGLRKMDDDVEGMNEDQVNKWDQAQSKFKRNTSKYDIVFNIEEGRKDLFFTIEYSTKLFKKETLERFIGYLKDIITILIEERSIKLKDIHIDYKLADAGKNIVFEDFGF